jgi:hypothetical protein
MGENRGGPRAADGEGAKLCTLGVTRDGRAVEGLLTFGGALTRGYRLWVSRFVGLGFFVCAFRIRYFRGAKGDIERRRKNWVISLGLVATRAALVPALRRRRTRGPMCG